MIKVAVGSLNPTKLEATKLGFERVYPQGKFEFVTVDVSSGVSDQPMTDSESIRGAINRAKQALKKAKADFAVGLEGGLQQVDHYWFECGWIAVVDRKGNLGIGCSPKLLVSKKAMLLIHQGKELGEVTDILFNTKDAKKKMGYFGLMTQGHITRAKGYSEGVIMALVRFLNPQIFE